MEANVKIMSFEEWKGGGGGGGQGQGGCYEANN